MRINKMDRFVYSEHDFFTKSMGYNQWNTVKPAVPQ
mgnify:CR=1 FL=1